MSDKPKIMFVGDKSTHDEEMIARLREEYEVLFVDNPVRALASLDASVRGVYFPSAQLNDGLQLGRLLKNERILEGMPDGVALLDSDNNVLWANDCLQQWLGTTELVGSNFYRVFGSPEILGPDFCPFSTALASGEASSSTLRCSDSKYYQVHCVPFHDGDGSPESLIVTVRDVTGETLQQQKLAAIHAAGVSLADLSAEDIYDMEVSQRIDFLKSDILKHTRDLLNFDVVEIRLLGQETGELVPLLSVGIDESAARRKLYARPQGQGVTGFVAATGKSYLCEDTTGDPLFIEGCRGAKSSLTVPLVQHDKVIGTFNVESPEPRAFGESDLQFLEIYSRDVAAALNTLELLVAQQANTAQASVEAIHREVALPVDEILNDAVHVIEEYIGVSPEVRARLQRILRNARDIKLLIQKVGQEMAPAEAVPPGVQIVSRPRLRNRRVLVVDDDETVRIAAHNLLDRYGCMVETAHDGNEAIRMVRNAASEDAYDVLISDIKLPDMTGYELLVKLKELLDVVPLVLMTGFGYDPGHTIVKARQSGLSASSVLYKPFRLDQLLETVEGTIEAVGKVPQA